MTPGDGTESRLHARAPVACRVRLTVADQEDFAAKFANNISEGGVFVAASGEVPIGAKVALEISLKSGAYLVRATGEVVRVEKADPQAGRKVGGLGIKFTEIDDESRKRIRDIVSRNKPTETIRPEDVDRGTADERRHPRVPVARKLRFVADAVEEALDAVTRNVSEGGMFVETRTPPTSGSEVDVEFALRDGEQLLLARAKVVWVRTAEEAAAASEPPGCGLEFVKLTAGNRQQILDLVKEWQQGKLRGLPAELPPPPPPVASSEEPPAESAAPVDESAADAPAEESSAKEATGGTAEASAAGEATEAPAGAPDEDAAIPEDSKPTPAVGTPVPDMAVDPTGESPAPAGQPVAEAITAPGGLPTEEDAPGPATEGWSRRYARVPLSRKIRIVAESVDEVVEAVTRNIGEGGMFVQIDRAPEAGSHVMIEFILGDGEPVLRARTRVVWIRSVEEATDEGDQAAGCGLEFLELQAGAEERIRELVAEWEIQHPQEVEPAGPIPAAESSAAAMARDEAGGHESGNVGLDLGYGFPRSAVVDGTSVRVISPKIEDAALAGVERLIGRKCRSRAVEAIATSLGAQVQPDARREVAVVLPEREAPVEELVASGLGGLGRLVADKIGREVAHVVLAVPGHFGPDQRQAVKTAARRAGMPEAELINATTAAVLSYSFNRNREQLVLAYALDGNGFEACLVQVTGNALEVLGRVGDPLLGADEIAAPVVAQLRQALADAAGGSLPVDDAALESELRAEARFVLDELARNEQVEVNRERFTRLGGHEVALKATVKREDVAVAAGELLDRTLALCDELFGATGQSADALQAFLLLGTAVHLPFVRSRAVAHLGLEPERSVDAERAAAIGAALLADAALRVDAVMITEVASRGVGVGLPGGGFELVIPQNTRLPVTEIRQIGAARASRTTLEVHLFGAASYHGGSHEYLSSYVLPAAQARDGPLYELSLGLDEQGLLEVSARDLESGDAISLGPAAPADPEEILGRLGAAR